jgi:hypothetical protein
MGLHRLALIKSMLFFLFTWGILLFWRCEGSAGSLQLSWTDNSTNESGFKIERKTGGAGTFAQIAAVAVDTTSYNDTGLIDGDTYCYRLFAFNVTDNSTYSNESCGVANSPVQTYTLTVTKVGTGSGTVTSAPAGINCGTDCAEVYNSGAAVTLMATANPGSVFAGWSSSNCGSFAIAANIECSATFTAVANSITTNISDGAVLSGASVLWTATPSGIPVRVEFWIDSVLRWTEFLSIYQFNHDPLGTLDTTTLINGSHQLRVRAVYADNSIAEKIITVTVSNGTTQQYFLAVTKSGTGSGTVTSSPAGIACGSNCSTTLNSGTPVTLTPAAAIGSTFAGWNDSNCGSFNITANTTCSATFNLIPPATYTLTVTKVGTGSGTVTSAPAGINCGTDCAEVYNSGAAVTLMATANPGSVFAGWNSSNCGSITIVANTSCTAAFTAVANSITTNISDGAVLSGASVLWTATPSGVPARVEFWIDSVLRWTELQSIYQFNGDPLGTLNTTTLINGSHELRVRAVYADNSIAEKIITVTVSNVSPQQLTTRIGIFRPTTGEWFLDLDGNGTFDGCGVDRCLTNYGTSGMRPVVGDWYGDGKTNIGVYEPLTGTWHLDDGNGTWDDCDSAIDLCITSFGAPGSFPVTKESSDADQILIGFFQPKVTTIVNRTIVTKLGLWKFDMNGNGILDSCAIDQCIDNFGQSGDLPVVGNWDGAGEKIGIFRPQSGEWLLDLNDNGMWDGSPVDRLSGPFGQFGDRPVVGDWDGNGVIRIGVFRPSTGQWFLDMNGNGQLDDCSVDACLGPFGQIGDRPVVGKW